MNNIQKGIIHNAKGDLVSRTYSPFIFSPSFENFPVTISVTLHPNGTTTGVTSGTPVTHPYWVETGSGWIGGGGYSMFDIIQTDASGALDTVLVPSFGPMSSTKTFSITLNAWASGQFYRTWTFKISDSKIPSTVVSYSVTLSISN